MQQDCTIFRIPRQSQVEPAAKNFDVAKTEAVQFDTILNKQATRAIEQSVCATSKQNDLAAEQNNFTAGQSNLAAQQSTFFSLQPNTQQSRNSIFPLYDELNFIAEELEKWRSKIY